MSIYETGLLNGHQADEFISMFDEQIGTETDVSKHGENQFVVMCYELTSSEVQKCKRLEKKALECTK